MPSTVGLRVGSVKDHYPRPLILGVSQMDLRHLRYFVAVAEERHFGRAATRLHMAQPPLSHTIRQLEAELGVELLHRNTRRVELTEAGAAYLEQARKILAEVDEAGHAARRVA